MTRTTRAGAVDLVPRRGDFDRAAPLPAVHGFVAPPLNTARIPASSRLARNAGFSADTRENHRGEGLGLSLGIVLAGCAIVLAGCSHRLPTPSRGLAATLLAKQGAPGGVLAVVRDGVVLDEGVFGSASLQLGVPVERSTLFQLASVTKVFSVVALLTLEAEGKLRLEDPIAKHLDGLPPAWRSVTLWQLVSHTAGLPDVIASPQRPLDDVELARSADEALAFAAARPIAAAAGTQFAYDQTSYVLIARVIEQVAKVSFRDFVTARVLADLPHTRWGDARQIIAGRADMYTALHGRLENGSNLFSYPPYLDAAAGLNSNLDDMERFAIALTRGRLLDARELERMWQPVRDTAGREFDLAAEMKLGGVFAPTAGWFYADNSGGTYPRVLMTGGSATSIVVFPKQKLAIVVLTNLQAKSDPLAIAESAARPYLPGLQPMF